MWQHGETCPHPARQEGGQTREVGGGVGAEPPNLLMDGVSREVVPESQGHSCCSWSEPHGGAVRALHEFRRIRGLA